MNKHPLLKKTWCANALVGAPWACGEATYENYKTDARVGKLKANNSKCSGMFEQCGGNNWTGPTCCESGSECAMENEWYSQCTPSDTPDGSMPVGAPQPTPMPVGAPQPTPMPVGAAADPSPTSELFCDSTIGNATSACDGGCAVMNPNQYPWIEYDEDGVGTLYGFAAVDAAGGKGSCGTCMSFDLPSDQNTNFNSEVGVTKGIVQITNLGGMGDIGNGYGTAAFDFLVPGGGTGDFTGCSQMPGWSYGSDASFSNQITSSSECDSGFGDDTDAAEACKKVLIDLMGSGGSKNANTIFKNLQIIDCPQKLINKTGLNGVSKASPNLSFTDVGGFTHYWDCCKPSCAWGNTEITDNNTDGEGLCANGYNTAVYYNTCSTPLPEDTSPKNCCSYAPFTECCADCAGLYDQGTCTAESGTWYYENGNP